MLICYLKTKQKNSFFIITTHWSLWLRVKGLLSDGVKSLKVKFDIVNEFLNTSDKKLFTDFIFYSDFKQLKIHELKKVFQRKQYILYIEYVTSFLNLSFHTDERHFLPGYDSALFYGAYAYQYDRETSGRSYR